MEKGQGSSKGNTTFQDSFKMLIRHARQKMSWRKPEKGARVPGKIKRMSEISKLPAPFTMTNRDGKRFFRSVALLTVFFFSWNQLGFSDGTILLDYEAPFQTYVPSTNGGDSDSVPEGSLPDRRSNEDFGMDSFSFISENSPLSAPDSGRPDEPVQDSATRSLEELQVMVTGVDERTLVRRDISLELRKVSTNTVEAVNRCYYSSAYGDPVYFTTYNYRDGLFMRKTETTLSQRTFRGFMEVDLSALYAGGIDSEQISRVELVFDAVSSQSGSHSFSIYDMTANEDGLSPADSISAAKYYTGTSFLVQSVTGKTFTRDVSQRNTVDVTESVLRDLRAGKKWTGFFATPDSAMSKIQLSNVRLKVTYEQLIPPVTGTIAINAGAAYALSPTVQLKLSAPDNGSGMRVGGMSFSNDNINWSPIIPYAKSKTYELPSGDGEKTVYVRYYDEAGNVSETCFASIILDTRSPEGSVAVNGGVKYIHEARVTLNLSAIDDGSGVGKMCFSSNGMTWTEAEDYAPTKEWTFSAGDGYKKVYVKYQDKSGRWSIASWVRVRLDTQIPTGSVNINAGVMYASSSKVKLHFKGSDKGSGMSGVSLSFDGTNWEAPIRFTSSTYVVLPDGDGVKTVYAKFYDKAGNVSPVYSDSIILDTLPPTGTVKVNGGVQFINQPTVTLNLNAMDEGSGLSKISFSNDGITWVMETSYSETKRWTFSSGDGVKKVYVKFQDNRGRWSPVTSVTVTLDTVAPSGSMTINGGAAYTNSREVMLNLSGTDNTSGIAGMSFSTNGSTWSAAEAYQTTKSCVLPSGDGQKTMYVRYYDAAGNVSKAYSKSIILDTTPPAVVIDVETPGLINVKTMMIHYMSDGIAKSKTFTDLVEGENTLSIIETDSAGNQTTAIWQVVVDTVAPSGMVVLNDGELETGSCSVTVHVNVTDDRALKDIRFSTDGGVTWSEWESRAFVKTMTLPEGEGEKEVLCQARDEAGNVADFKGTIYYVVTPQVRFLSDTVVTDPLYTLRYMVNDKEREETWSLQPGENRLIVKAGSGSSPSFFEYTVTLDRTEDLLPPMPEVPILSDDLVSMTAVNGLILKYSRGELVAIEKPGAYTLYPTEFDSQNELVDGLLVFNDGGKLLYENGKASYRLSEIGELTTYNADGTVASVTLAGGKKVRFAYRHGDTGEILSIISYDEDATGFYGSDSKPFWIKKNDGTVMTYHKGFLKSYQDPEGNVFHYQVSSLYESEQLTGYRSDLAFVSEAGEGELIPLAAVLANPDDYVSIRATLENDLSLTMEYDADGVMKKVVSGSGEALELQKGLPVSFTNRSGETLTVRTDLSENQELLSISLEGSDIRQEYDGDGNLTGIRLNDGTTFKIRELGLDRIVLEDGSDLSELVWNGSRLTGFRKTDPDGRLEIYQNSRMTQRVEPDGGQTSFVDNFGAREPEEILTSDGRTYQVIRFPNAEGLTQRLAQLKSVDLPDGTRIEIENGKPVRYIQARQVQIEAFEVPELLAGESFVPLIELPDARLRSLTVNADGFIYSGEILFNDGTQYLIENNKIAKQIAPDGQFVEFSEEITSAPSQPNVPPEPLTEPEIDYRNHLIEAQMRYFVDGIGIHAATGFPVDNYQGESDQPSDYSQSTLIGFWAEILAAIATGDYQTSGMTQAQAFERLDQLLVNYREVQKQVGWNGMVAFFKIVETEEPVLDALGEPTGETRNVIHYQNCFNQYGFGDSVNLSVSLASVIGALQGKSWEPENAAICARILSSANEILEAQEPGYAAFYDPVKKRFRGAYAQDSATGTWSFVKDYYIDRVFNEFRSGVVWVAAKYPQYQQAFENLDVTLRDYRAGDGTQTEIAAPFDGGAFQMFWPLIHVDETRYPEFETALRNFLHAQADFTSRNGIPGLISAGDCPGSGYEGKIGLPSAAEGDDLKFNDIGSLYGTASAFGVAPHYTLQFLKNIETAFPEILTSAGFVDAIRMQTVTSTDPVTGETTTKEAPVFSTQYFGVDQASFILSLLKTSQKYFDQYLDQEGIRREFDGLYESIQLNLKPANSGGPSSLPEWGDALTRLYDGDSTTPDGFSAPLVREASFVPAIFDPELGSGRIFNYRQGNGAFHHSEIEFGEGPGARIMGIQEYLLLPGRADAGRALLGGYQPDLYNKSDASGVFYTPDQGYAESMLTRDPELGEVRRVIFDFRQPAHAVGLWNDYRTNQIDLGQFDFLSIPVRVEDDTPENLRLKFELKGTGNIFVTDTLRHGWQYITIPVVKPVTGKVYEIATVIQSVDGQPVKGGLYLGPLSGFRVRTSNELDWSVMLGKTASEMQTLIRSKIAAQAFGAGLTTAEEILEDFTLDSKGNLIDGTLRRADGGIQYFRDGLMTKWVFRNGRTVLYENGIANFIVDLSRGRLETGRFYYDQDLKGNVHSFNIQDNERKRTFGEDGMLRTLVQDGQFVNFENGKMDSIRTPRGTLTDLEFADDGSLLKAHVVMNDGRVFDIDQTTEQSTDIGNGVTLHYQGSMITAIETSQNGRTDLSYTCDSAGRLAGVDATFTDRGQTRTLSFFEYIQRPERSIEKSYLMGSTFDVFSVAGVGGFSVGTLTNGEFTLGMGGNYGYDSKALYKFRYLSESGRTLGMYMNHANSPLQISDYGFISLTVRQDPSMNWNQDFALKLKSPSCRTLYTFSLDSTVSGDQTFWFPLEGKTGLEGEITLEVIRQKEGVGKIGAVYVKDLSYINIKNLDHPVWENELGILSSQIRNFKIESDNLMNVGARIATKESVRYEALVPYLDTPTRILYTDTRDAENQLVNFTRLDGSQVEIEGEHVSRLIFPDGTVNEYSSNFQNSTQGTIEGPGETPGGVFDYRYGALRRITQADGRQYDLSYEFDVDGQEITVFKDVLSGEERRFRDGKLVSARDGSGLRTDYEYRDGTLIGAEMTYRDRVLNSTRYAYQNEGTQVTDERGTIWFYDTKGTLIKHMTKDGLLYEYSEYVQPLEDGQTVDLRDYKSALYAESGLRAVSLKGYQAPDGSWIIFEGDQGSEVHLVSGATAVNLVFDEDQRIKAGQIQFPDGLILEIEDYVPVRGRLAEGSLFEQSLPQGSAREIVQDEEGGFLGFQCKVGDYTMTYNAAGELVRAETGAGASHYFTYTKDTQGRPTAATETALTQVAFNGVPFPKELELLAGSDQKILDSGKEIARHEGSGFLVGVYKESLNQWDVYSGSFSSQADRTGLEHFLSGVKAGESVAAAVSDPSFSKAGEGILSLFEGLGAGQVRQAASGNRKWTFFGNERLSAGEGRDAIDQASFSTVTKNVMTYSIDSDSHPTFRDAPMLLDFEMSVSRAYDSFLKEYQPLKLDRDLQRMTVYDAKNEMIYTQRLDGLSSFYEFGKVRETFDKEGNLLSLHEYGCLSGAGAVPPCQNSEDMTLSRITLVKARQDLETEVQNAAEKIAQARFDALYKLAWQDDVARLQIKESVNAGVAEINRQISSLESQRYQTVKKCRRYVFVKHCEEHTYEVPGVQSAINGLVSQRADLIRTGEEQLAAIPGAMAEKQLEIEQATAEKIAELEAQRKSVILDLLHQEMEPILTDFYRRILGRDASEEEFDDWVDRFKGTEAIDISALETELSASPERAAREAEKALIIQGVRDFLNNYLASSVEERVLMLQELRLEAPEVVDLASSDADAILAWLKSRDLHFGQSAFLSLKKMLASSGAEVSMTTLGRESILIDILTGTIHKFTEGDLLISMFALDRTALIHARDFAAVRYSFEDLKDLYQSACGSQAPACGVRVIAHIGEDHFVLVKNVTETEVTYEETGKGIGGSDVTVTREQFLSVWNTKGNTGYLLVEASQAIPEKRLSDREAMRVRGAFFAIFFFVASIVLTAVSVAVSFFSPTMGKILGYAALVAGIIGIVASLGQLVVQGLRMAFSNVTANGLFSTMAQGIMNLGKVIWESVKSVGRFVLKGFQFLKGGFTGGFGSFGAGITNMRSFLFDGARVLADGTREFTFSQIAARQLVAAGLTSGVSIGLEGLGIDSRVAGLAGVFAGGGFLGIGTSVSGFLKSGLQQLVLQGVSEMAVHVGLPPPLASALSLIATQSLNSFFDPGLTLKAGLLQIAPDVATQLTLGGLELLGRSIGLDPRITALMGLPVAAAVGGVTKDLLNPNSMTSLWQSIQNAILSREVAGGVLSLGASIVVHELGVDQSLLGSLSSRLVAGVFSDFLASPGKFNFVDSIIKSVDESFYEFFNPALLPMLFDAVMDYGLADGIEKYAVMLFTKETINEIASSGMNLGQWIARGLPAAEDVIYQGGQAKRLRLVQNGKSINFIYLPKGEKLELQAIYEEYSNGRKPRLVEFTTDDEGRITQVMVIEQMADGTFRQDVLTPTGNIKEVILRDWNNEVYGKVSYNAAGDLEFTNYSLGISDYLTADGRFSFDFTTAPDFQDMGQLIYDFNVNLKPEDIAQLTAFSYGNGFWNAHRSPDSISTLMNAFIDDRLADNARTGTPAVVLFEANGEIARDRHGNILTTASLPVTLYEETGLVGNILRWAAGTWFGVSTMRDEVERELIRYLDLIELNQGKFNLDPNMNFVHFAHSGNFQPFIQALEHMPDEYRSKVKTLVAYGAPYVGDGVINDPFLETLVRVRGTKDGVPFEGVRQFQITDQNGNVKAIPNQYNIEIIGAAHNDFSYDPSFTYSSAEEREIARKTSLFMRDLNLIANDKTTMEDFLKSDTWPGISYDKNRNVVIVNPSKYVERFPR
ncbi:MAG: Ig-like domain repeat protein [Candidatus Omnitrophota bacterium]